MPYSLLKSEMRGKKRRQAADYANYADGRAGPPYPGHLRILRAHPLVSRNPRPVSFLCPSLLLLFDNHLHRAIDRNPHDSVRLIHPAVALQNLVFGRAHVLQIRNRR